LPTPSSLPQAAPTQAGPPPTATDPAARPASRGQAHSRAATASARDPATPADPKGAATPAGDRAGSTAAAVPAPNGDAALVAAPPAAPGVASTQAAAQPAPAPDAPSAVAQAPLAPPATQLGHALAALHTGADGTSHTTIRLDPAELGQVQVRITRGHDGAASVSIAVERPETLRSLQADLGHLHQALDRAGVPEQRSLAVHLAQPDTPPAWGGAGGGGAAPGGQEQGGARQDRGQSPGARTPTGTAADTTHPGQMPPAPTRWLRAGVNITA
jgi:flagellar hook-length control protein FliK